jgi:ATP-dependent HslUV protease subunit HslV
MRACVELAKEWRQDKYLRKLEAVMIVADKDVSLSISGIGDVVEPQFGIMGTLLCVRFVEFVAIGSGGNYALAAARALVDTQLSAQDIALKSMNIAADLCIYTNHNFVVEKIDCKPATPVKEPFASEPAPAPAPAAPASENKQ